MTSVQRTEQSEMSVGIIPISKNKRFLLVHHAGGHWGFPKGHKEPGEDDEIAARRELLEETGIDDCTIPDAERVSEAYSFVKNDVLVTKSVEYFVALVESEDLGVRTAPLTEIATVAWFTRDDCLDKLTYDESKKLLLEATQLSWVKALLEESGV